jgi:hypothetical protein
MVQWFALWKRSLAKLGHTARQTALLSGEAKDVPGPQNRFTVSLFSVALCLLIVGGL